MTQTPHRAGPEWTWALNAGRAITLVVLAGATVALAAPEHRVLAAIALAVSFCGSAYGLRQGPERWIQRLLGLALFAVGGVALLAADGRAPGWLACGVAIIAGVARLPLRPGLVFAGAVVAATCLAPLARGAGRDVPLMAAICAAALVVALVISGARNRAVTAEQLLEAEQAARESAAERDRLAERQRIARELHDILAHTLSAQTVQLEGARLLLDRGALEPARERILVAQRMARDGLEQTRRAVQSLRGDARPLVEVLRALAADADARYAESGEPWPLTPPEALTVERTVQEGLTNARKHAPGATVTVLVAYTPDELRVEVKDTGWHGNAAEAVAPADIPPGGGYGLTGMHERAALIGADLLTGPDDSGPDGKGYRICLTLPRSGPSASSSPTTSAWSATVSS
ncbi:histidine kinase [Actinoplanes sp. SE50]|uniref:sensor histidine kinase n=1 Tax=unclassified Actinoplanes TaxID=2626549 RepID=UPI00023ECB9C|nr:MULTISPECIES: histidine kinase [unclassified Actinoplanes]AEV86553.1 histidine kinase [Actinoplanes sp. SE50/110]ATO84951.1 histidine kinase [Actinoplanes sp. SE50]SLM02360.1 two-component system sensor histidine kinase [Actinoplanes sp. SE50/110]